MHLWLSGKKGRQHEQVSAPVCTILKYFKQLALTLRTFPVHMSKKQPEITTDQPNPLLLFDGVCNLCNSSVQWVLKHDKAAQFRFAALQSDTGRQILLQHQLDPDATDTVVLVDEGRVFTRSDVAIQVFRRFGWPWAALTVFKWIPTTVRNYIYDWIARNRYRWFGRQQECWLPRPEWKERFV